MLRNCQFQYVTASKYSSKRYPYYIMTDSISKNENDSEYLSYINIDTPVKRTYSKKITFFVNHLRIKLRSHLFFRVEQVRYHPAQPQIPTSRFTVYGSSLNDYPVVSK